MENFLKEKINKSKAEGPGRCQPSAGTGQELGFTQAESSLGLEPSHLFGFHFTIFPLSFPAYSSIVLCHECEKGQHTINTYKPALAFPHALLAPHCKEFYERPGKG